MSRLGYIFILIFYTLMFFAQIQLKEIPVTQQALSNVCILKNGTKSIVSGYDGKLYVIDLIKGAVENSIEAHQTFILAMSYYPAVNLLATAGWDKKIKLWNAQNFTLEKEIPAQLDKINALAFSSDGKKIASGSEDFTTIVWEVASGNKLYTFRDARNGITSVDISPNDKWLAAGSWDKRVYLYSLENGNLVSTLTGHYGVVTVVSFSPDSKYLVSGGEDNQVFVWDIEKNARKFSFSTFSSPIMDAKFFLNGRFLFVVEKNTKLHVFDLNAGREVDVNSLAKATVKKIALSDEKAYLMTAREDGVSQLFNIKEYKFFDCLTEKMDSFADLKKPKAEFETSDQYNKRIREYNRKKTLKLKDCEAEYQLMLKAQKEKEEQELLASYKYVTFPVTIGNYNADKKELTIQFNDQTFTVSMTPDEAKSLKANEKNAILRGIERMNNQQKEVINFELIHPVSNKKYPVGNQISPAQDKILAKFLQSQQQSQKQQVGSKK